MGLFSILVCFTAAGDYVNPPDWRASPFFTHQSWDFNYPSSVEPNGPPLPVPPDGDPNCLNPFAEPCLIDVRFDDYPAGIPGIVGYMWDASGQFETNRRGYWGGMGNVTLTFKIPDTARPPFAKKQIWIQMTYLARKDGGTTYSMAVASDPNITDANQTRLAFLHVDTVAEPEGDVSKWYRLTAACVLPGQPQAEYVRLTAFHLPISAKPPMGGASMIDEVDIDTRTVTPDFTGVVNLADFAALAKEYKTNSSRFDLCPDGQIDLKDLSIFLESWLAQGDSP
jgi:hypothetical protein